MKVISTIAAVIFTLGLVSTLQANDTDDGRGTFKVHLKTGKTVLVDDGIMKSNSLSIKTTNGTKPLYNFTEMTKLERRVGSNWYKGAFIGAATTFVIFAIVLNKVARDRRQLNGSAVGPALFGFTFAGFGIGAGMGAASGKWEKASIGIGVENGKSNTPPVSFSFSLNL